jgi:hypothetical protein
MEPKDNGRALKYHASSFRTAHLRSNRLSASLRGRENVDRRATRLDSWKAIAGFLGRDVSTVRRSEKESGLPVHHVPGDKGHSVYAYTDEVDAWLRGSGQSSAQPVPAKPKTPPRSFRRALKVTASGRRPATLRKRREQDRKHNRRRLMGGREPAANSGVGQAEDFPPQID